MQEPASDTTTKSDGREADPSSFMQEHPVAMLALGLAILGGAATGYVYLSEALTPIRSILGGAVAGFGCWLLVMVGRVIGE